MNQTLQQIHSMLLAQHIALSQALDVTTDVTKANAILMEMQEILHRINVAQNLLFTQSSQQLDAMLPDINQANSALTTSLASINSAADVINSTSNFLKGVDQAIDFAKTLAAS